MNPPLPAKQTYRTTVLPIIRRARGLLLPRFGAIEWSEKEEAGGLENLLTECDTAVERFLKAELARPYPDIAFVGEEDGGDRSAERFWLVDPIDGTAYFVRGMPFCTSQLALIEQGEVVFSAVYDFVSDVLYHAEKSAGAFRDEARIKVSARPLQKSRMEVSIEMHDPSRLQSLLALKKRCRMFHVGASGYELALVASGKLDGSVHYGPGSKDYDIAPGALLVKEAGGGIANIGARHYDYRNGNFIAANPIVFKELTEGPDAIFPIQS